MIVNWGSGKATTQKVFIQLPQVQPADSQLLEVGSQSHRPAEQESSQKK